MRFFMAFCPTAQNNIIILYQIHLLFQKYFVTLQRKQKSKDIFQRRRRQGDAL